MEPPARAPSASQQSSTTSLEGTAQWCRCLPSLTFIVYFSLFFCNLQTFRVLVSRDGGGAKVPCSSPGTPALQCPGIEP